MFVLLSRIKVEHYNAQQCKDIVMPVPIHAAVMLGHALGARLNKPVKGVALVLHDAKVEQEFIFDSASKSPKRLLANKRGATAFYIERAKNGGGYSSKSTTPSAMSYQMHATANGCFSLALDFGDAQITEAEVRDQMRAMRFAGGTMQLGRIETAESVVALLTFIRSGYLVMDASARAAKALAQGQEPAHVFLHKHQGAYVVPAVVGYQLLTDLSLDRKGIRRTPGIDLEGHAFAESIIGLIEFRHINRYKFSSSDTAQSPLKGESEFPETSIFWHHHWTPDNSSFLIKQAHQL